MRHPVKFYVDQAISQEHADKAIDYSKIRLLLHEVDVTVFLEELEITYPVEI
jgi:hypothetical protein